MKPTTPQNEAGRITEPLVWLPIAKGAMPAATAAAEPLDEPPGVRAGSCGLRVLPGVKQANSVVTVLPSTTAPAARSRATIAASWSGRRPAWMTLPCSVGKSAVSTMSLTATGTPCSGPSALPGALALVECARLGAGMLGIEMRECLDAGLVRRDPARDRPRSRRVP